MLQNLGAGSILGARNVTCRVHAEDPQISGVILQVVVAMAIWLPGFVHSWHCNIHYEVHCFIIF